jgi:hypothetical protein
MPGGDVEELAGLVGAFVAADSWPESRALVERHPELLSDLADSLIGEMMGAAERNDDDQAVRVFATHRALLRRCREVGVAVGFQEVVGAGVPAGLRSSWSAAAEAEEQYRASGRPADFDAAVAAFTALVGHRLFPNGPAEVRARASYALGALLMDRFLRGSRPADLDDAVEQFQAAVDATPPDSADRSDRLTALGNALGIRYEEQGNDRDLMGGIDAVDEAARLLPPDGEQVPSLLANLAANLGVRYEVRGDPHDLEAAIDAAQRAVAAGAASPDLSSLLANLVNALADRYERSGSLEDLWTAVDQAEHAITTGSGSPNPVLLATLGNVLQLQYDRDHQPRTLDRAITSLKEAAAALPSGTSRLAVCLGNLGNALFNRAELTGAIDDLDAALETFRRALTDTDPESSRAPLLWSGLGRALLARSGRTDSAPADLEDAIAALERAAQISAMTAPVHPLLLGNLAGAYRTRYERGGQETDLAAAADLYRRATLEALDRQAEVALEAAASWGDWASARASWREAAGAYELGLQSAEQLFRTQFGRADKEVWLGAASGLPARAAYAAVRADRNQDAIAVMERGRAQLLTEALQYDRADLRFLHEHRNVLARRYEDAAARVRELERRDLSLWRRGLGPAIPRPRP